jgi:CRP-like cAMP-binding protein
MASQAIRRSFCPFIPRFYPWRLQVNLDPSAFVADPDLILTLEKGSSPISCGGDRVLFRQGEIPVGLYILNRGELTLTMTSPGGEQVIQMQASAGSLLGLPGLISGEPYTLTAIARSGASLSFVSRDDFTSLMQTNPRMALKMLEVLAAEVRSARHALSSL